MDYSQRTAQTRRGALTDDRRSGRQLNGSLRLGRGSGNRYQLKSRNIRFRGKGNAGMTRFGGLDPRKLIMLALGVVLAILLFFASLWSTKACARLGKALLRSLKAQLIGKETAA